MMIKDSSFTFQAGLVSLFEYLNYKLICFLASLYKTYMILVEKG